MNRDLGNGEGPGVEKNHGGEKFIIPAPGFVPSDL